MAKQHEPKIVQIQANYRGYLVRKKTTFKKSKKNNSSSRKDRGKEKSSVNEVCPRSQRSGEIIFKGGGMPGRKGQDSYRNGLVYAKALTDMPDYSSFATRETEKKLGPFAYDEDSQVASD